MQLLKGIISSVRENTAEVSLPEHGDQVTAPLPFYQHTAESGGGISDAGVTNTYSPGQFVVVLVFGDDFNDGVIL